MLKQGVSFSNPFASPWKKRVPRPPLIEIAVHEEGWECACPQTLFVAHVCLTVRPLRERHHGDKFGPPRYKSAKRIANKPTWDTECKVVFWSVHGPFNVVSRVWCSGGGRRFLLRIMFGIVVKKMVLQKIGFTMASLGIYIYVFYAGFCCIMGLVDVSDWIFTLTTVFFTETNTHRTTGLHRCHTNARGTTPWFKSLFWVQSMCCSIVELHAMDRKVRKRFMFCFCVPPAAG